MNYETTAGNEIKIETPKIKRVIPLEELPEHGYADMAKLAVIFNHEVVEMENGTWRWKPNRLVSWLGDHAPFYTPSSAECHADGKPPYVRGSVSHRGSIDLNNLVLDLHSGVFAMEEYMKWQMQSGYSLSGYGEIFGQHEASEYGLEGAKEPPEDDPGEEYTETVIDYMIRIHEGKVLKI